MSSIESLLRQDRRIAITALTGLIFVAWVYLVFMARGMDSAQRSLMMTPPDAWNLAVAIAVFAMWAIMMIGMMLPSAAPMILLYAAILRRRPEPPAVLGYTAVFLSGYIVTWTAFSAAATGLQWWFASLRLVSPMMTSTSEALNGGILVAAGIYQWLPFKTACLHHCRSPAEFIARHNRPGIAGAFYMGLHHGVYCIGCCWMLMLLLFVGGVMNLLWIALLAAFVLIEKLLPRGRQFGRIAGIVMLVAGIVLIV